MDAETSDDLSLASRAREPGDAPRPAPRIEHAEVIPRPATNPGWRLHRLTAAVLLLGVAITAALTVTSEISYRHNEQRLTTLETKLTSSLLKGAPVQIEGVLGRIVGVAAESADPAATFQRDIGTSLAPKGPYASATLWLVQGGSVQVLDHVGSSFIRSPTSPASVAALERAAKSMSVVTTRVVGGGEQKIGYLLSAPGPAGTYVLSVSQELPVAKRVTVRAGSPDADLNFAIYFGRTTNASALIETNVPQLPLSGTVSQNVVPFGSSVLTLVVSPRAPLSGPWSELLPWGILVVGVLLTGLVVAMTDRLTRRRAYAESLAAANRRLYGEQRDVSLTLQRALLPRALPAIPGIDMAARYIPSVAGVEVGGDWYSVVTVDADRFAFVVGDVSGHGIAAASVMGSLRYTVRTLAKLGFSPSDILDRANGEIDVTEDGHFATVLVGVVNLRTSEMLLASAGHLLPLLVRGQTATYAEIPVGMPLGISDEPYVSARLGFPTGSMLVAFTDGLVEDRAEILDAGLGRLADVAVSEGARTADALLNAVVATLARPDNQDDIAILAIRR